MSSALTPRSSTTASVSLIARLLSKLKIFALRPMFLHVQHRQLSMFREDLKLGLGVFEERRGRGFLIGPEGCRRFVARTDTHPRGVPKPALTLVVKPLLRRLTSNLPFICLGRWSLNDVVFADETVSGYHAMICHDANGFLIQDAKSRNGTFVDGVPAPKIGSPDALLLKPGCTVQLGGWSGTFADVAMLAALCEQMST